MKKNRAMRAASALLVAVLMTTCTISGTFAKYITSESSSDNARVAKWGVTVDTAVAGAFFTQYLADGTYTDYNGNSIAKTVVSSTSDKLVAPGTECILGDTIITGTPEVAVNVKKEATLTLTGWALDGDDYCPIIFTVNGTKYYIGADIDATPGVDITDVAELIAAVEGAVETDVNYQANTDLTDPDGNPSTPNDNVLVIWEWEFEGGKPGATLAGYQTDYLDTKLGNKIAAGDDVTIAFTLTTTVTQLD